MFTYEYKLGNMYWNIVNWNSSSKKILNEIVNLFYNSETYELINEGIADLHCRGAKYLAQELMLEYGIMKHKSYPKDLVH